MECGGGKGTRRRGESSGSGPVHTRPSTYEKEWDSIIKLLRCHLEDCKQGWDGTGGKRRGS